MIDQNKKTISYLRASTQILSIIVLAMYVSGVASAQSNYLKSFVISDVISPGDRRWTAGCANWVGRSYFEELFTAPERSEYVILAQKFDEANSDLENYMRRTSGIDANYLRLSKVRDTLFDRLQEVYMRPQLAERASHLLWKIVTDCPSLSLNLLYGISQRPAELFLEDIREKSDLRMKILDLEQQLGQERSRPLAVPAARRGVTCDLVGGTMYCDWK